MIKSVTVVNHLGESLKLDLASPEKSGFIVKSIEGLGPVKALDSITRRSQSTDECFNCPIAAGCAWCSAWNYQKYGTPNKRDTGICLMHKARSLANVYYWNKWYKQNGDDKKFKMYLPKQDALQIISEDDYNMLLDLSNN